MKLSNLEARKFALDQLKRFTLYSHQYNEVYTDPSKLTGYLGVVVKCGARSYCFCKADEPYANGKIVKADGTLGKPITAKQLEEVKVQMRYRNYRY